MRRVYAHVRRLWRLSTASVSTIRIVEFDDSTKSFAKLFEVRTLYYSGEFFIRIHREVLDILVRQELKEPFAAILDWRLRLRLRVRLGTLRVSCPRKNSRNAPLYRC